ncbi:EAL and HDOD domain-containing protein [Cellulomonas sp. P24]|uniref:EAL and HDOD domain-containing protein n=1 Tax=Cellulomonas sp. P24 TaxID=2885206 RepID=UPI00216AC53E|nr:HDOD domain-containing protein [Cellulomonas sp. P24]MCR6493436.1 HDOD domain-containing protein [Cellulomonas sp. P24]
MDEMSNIPVDPHLPGNPPDENAAAVAPTQVAVHRQPVIRSDRSVYGYAVQVSLHTPGWGPLTREPSEITVENQYAQLHMATLAGDCALFLRATPGMLRGTASVPTPVGGLVLEVPATFAERLDAADAVDALSDRQIRIALADYTGTPAQDALLPSAHFVKVDLSSDVDVLRDLVERAHQDGVAVIGERADSDPRTQLGMALGVDLLQGPIFSRDAPMPTTSFSAGELQCLELMQLLSAEEIDHVAVVRVVSADPELAVRVLRLVNSSAVALRRQVDSVRQAVVLVGPQQLGALAMASLMDARPSSLGSLWFILARATACRTLAGSDAAYTVGLLSAIASHQSAAPSELANRTGVSADVANALRDNTGPYGAALAAVLAHEENDIAAVQATGFVPSDVATVYLAAVAAAFGTATSLAGTRSSHDRS